MFSWHPTCMSVAFILLLLQAIVIFSPESSLAPTSPRNEKLQLHWILHAFGLVSAIGGFASVYLNKEIHGRTHFTTWHGTVGLAALCGAAIAVLGGISAKYSHNISKWIRPVNVKMYHATGGMMVFLLAMVAVSLSTYSNWFRNRVSAAWLSRLIFWMPFILALCVARQVTQSYLPKVLKPKESEQDAKARKIQQKIDEKLSRKANKQDSSQSEEDQASSQENSEHQKDE